MRHDNIENERKHACTHASTHVESSEGVQIFKAIFLICQHAMRSTHTHSNMQARTHTRTHVTPQHMCSLPLVMSRIIAQASAYQHHARTHALRLEHVTSHPLLQSKANTMKAFHTSHQSHKQSHSSCQSHETTRAKSIRLHLRIREIQKLLDRCNQCDHTTRAKSMRLHPRMRITSHSMLPISVTKR